MLSKRCFVIFGLIGSLLLTACGQTSQTPTTPPQVTLQAATPSATPSVEPVGSTLRGVFEGITPCSQLTRPLPQIPADTNCEQMIWKLTLQQDALTGTPTTYILDSAYGTSLQGTNGLVGGGTPIAMEGKWAIVQGSNTDADAVIYQLNPDTPESSVQFLQISEALLHILHKDQTLMVGNGAWAYTLNQTDNLDPITIDGLGSAPEGPTRPPMPPTPDGSAVFGVFEGRMRCHLMVLDFVNVAPFAGCAKIKWRLTLYQDQLTKAPTRYHYMGTTTIHEGNWSILQGTPSDPNATVYQLQYGDAPSTITFLKVGEDHLYLLDPAKNLLVGDAFFSYTLSRKP